MISSVSPQGLGRDSMGAANRGTKTVSWLRAATPEARRAGVNQSARLRIRGGRVGVPRASPHDSEAPSPESLGNEGFAGALPLFDVGARADVPGGEWRQVDAACQIAAST